MRYEEAKFGISCTWNLVYSPPRQLTRLLQDDKDWYQLPIGIHSLLEWIISSFIDDDIDGLRPCLVLSSINQLIKNEDRNELIKEMIQVVVVSPYPFFEYLISDRRGKDMIGISSIIHQSTRYEWMQVYIT